ncbi:hypothetical protein L6164_001502 [Bauhinia variegata]|uniref:Uncharacterized protein n=1 Tax=Bauhinia variegata TaxID=167791 RepID=A0ACB9Q9Q2_BAUVA|nr:hypothetical protein L6164_001502 [Bauhinia variegata]
MATTTIPEEMSNLDTYPPLFHHQNQTHNPNPENSSDDPIQDLDLFPVIDLQGLTLNPDEKQRLEVACKSWGFFRLVNHGIPTNLLTQLENQAKEIFSMSFESKRAATSNSPISHFSGTGILTPQGTALERGNQLINWVEGFNVPLGKLSQFKYQAPAFDSFSVLLQEYGNHLSRIARALFEAMVKNLDLDVVSSKPYLSEETGYVRVYRYPAKSDADSGLGMEEHTDSSVLSILHQSDGVSGLEILKDDKWQTVNPLPNSLIVNVGDMMQALSDDRFKSVTHRVKVNKERDRVSICYFVFPTGDVPIHSSSYKPFTYSDFRAQVDEDVKTIGFKVGLKRFRFTKDQH